jgi:hypothetical protein
MKRHDLLPVSVIKNLLPAVGVWCRPRWRQGQALAGGLRPAWTPAPGDSDIGSRREQVRGCTNREPGECLWEGDVGLGWAVG